MYYGSQNAAYEALNRDNSHVYMAPVLRCDEVPLQSCAAPEPEAVETVPVIKQDLSMAKIWDDYRNDCKEAFVTDLKIGLELKQGGKNHEKN